MGAASFELVRLAAGAAVMFGAFWLLVAIDARGDRPESARAASDGSASDEEIAPGRGPVRYELSTVLDTREHRIAGSGVIRWKNTSVLAQRELWLHLYLNAFKNERTLFMRSPREGGFRGDGLRERWGYITIERLFAREQDRDLWPGAARTSPGDPEDETDILVPLASEVAPGGELTLELRFVAQLPSVVLRTGCAGSFCMAAQFFPKLARLEPDGRWAHFPFHRLGEFYADFADYDVSVDVPEGFLVGATGVPEGEPMREGGRLRQKYRATRVVDFAFTAWDGFEEKRQRAGPIELVALFPKGERHAAEIELETVTQGLTHFGERYGSYPYRRLTVVRPPRAATEAGGMEYPMLITTGARARLRFLGVRSIELLALHELAHQWFYGVLASDEYRHPFLDEGLASFAEIDALEQRWPDASGLDAFGMAIGAPAVARALAAQVAGRGPIARAASDFATGSSYAGLVYARTATTLLTLGRVYGERQLRAALGRYAREQRFLHPDPEALAQAVRSDMGEAAAAALRAALAGGTVDYSMAQFSSWTNDAPQGIFGDPRAPAQRQSPEDPRYRGFVTLRRVGTLAFPIEVEVWSVGGGRTRLTWDGHGDEVVLPWRGDAAIAAVVIDPDGRVLLDGDLSNNAMRGSSQRIAPRVLGAGAFFAQLAMGALLP